MSYEVILADPPWRQTRGGRKAVRPNSSGGDLSYSTLTLDEIEVILNRFSLMGADNHVFFLWTIDKYLCDAEAMMEDMGYKRHARFVWNKVTGIPAAFTVRYGHEYMTWFYKGKLMPIDFAMRGKIHTVFTEQVTKHSKKPETSYKIIESFYPNAKKLELFARGKRENWDVWGAEAENPIKVTV